MEERLNLSVAFRCPDRLRRSDHLVVGAVAASEHRESSSVGGHHGLLRRLIARAPEVFMKDAKENRYLLHSVLREIQELMAVTRPI
jgi:hypothetical protein